MRLDNIGDVVMTGPALRAVKSNLPDAHLTLMASPGGSKAASLLPWVDDVLPWRVVWQDLGRLAFDPEREAAMIERLRAGRFDAAVIFTSFKQTPHPAGYACYLAGIPLRLGESKEWSGGVLSDEAPPSPDELHQVERNLRLVEHVGFGVEDRSLGLRVPEAARVRATALLEQRGVAPGEPYFLISPWTSAQARTYPTDRFADAARRLSGATGGWPVVVTGTEADREKSAGLLDAIGERAVDVVGETDLPELAALVRGARLVLTNNTSTMHLADALRTPEVVLFSGTELPEQWRPRTTPHRLLRREVWCSPCYLFECPYNLECLDVPPEEVVEAGLSLLAQVGDGPATTSSRDAG
jgi:ADP-heptose:LPS heptosyltransferase